MSESVLYPGWETVRKIGSGSFGAVYEIARTLPNGKTEKAALKVISIPQNEGDVEELYSSGYDDASITAHFKSYLADIVNEYSLMAEIKGHTNVVYCDDIRYIQHDDGFGWDIFIKMELLTPLMKAKEPGAVEDTVKKLGADICSALVLCREKNIIHRDIKPQNIFVSEHGDYKLGDFGIAKTVEKTTGGTKIGTYGYMAPEVYNNQPYGAAADIYSLGLVLYWLLNEHRLPFLPMPPKVPTSTENEQARLRRFRGEPIPAPKNGSEALKRIVLKACAYDPSDRYHTADEMLADLNALQGSPAAAPERIAPAAEAEAPEDAETATRGVFTVGTARTAAPALDAEKTEGTVGVFGREPEKAEAKPQKKAGEQKKPPKRIYAAILGGVLCAALAVALVWILGSRAPSPVVIPFSTEIGSTVELGHYEQDGDPSNGAEPIEWYVISKDEDSNMLLLLSKYGLDNVQYHSQNTNITWADCDLRKWLNSEDGFWGTAFSKEEKASIANTICKTCALDARDFFTLDGECTSDRVFLLGGDELNCNGYYKDAKFSDFQANKYVLSQENEWLQRHPAFWLRTQKQDADNNYIVLASDGGGYYYSSPDDLRLLRPAVWVAADGVRASSDAISHRPKSFFLNMGLNELEQEFAQLLDAADSWTEASAPQTIDSFPFSTQSTIVDLLDKAANAQTEVNITGSTLILKTNLLDVLSLPDAEHVDSNMSLYSVRYSGTTANYGESSTFSKIDSTTYAAQIPDDPSGSNTDLKVEFFGSEEPDGWFNGLSITYNILNGQIADVADVSLQIVESGQHGYYGITWSRSSEDGCYTILVDTEGYKPYYALRYDIATGKLLSLKVW